MAKYQNADQYFARNHYDAGNDPDAPRFDDADPPEPVARWQPFPTEQLPEALSKFVVETSAALGCDESMVALPALATCAAAVGTTRTIALKQSWTEPSVLFTAVVARSGTLKSPAFDAAIEPLRRAQFDALADHQREMESYELDLAAYEAQDKRGKANSTKPEPPIPTRYLVSDITIEALGAVLVDNPRGVLVARDELSGWLGSFNQYRAKGGADLQAWLELYRAGALLIDRKHGDRRTLAIPSAAASVTGTVQPGALEAALTDLHWQSGLAARLLLARPPERKKRWTDRVPPVRVVDRYGAMIRALLAIQPATLDDGRPEPVRLPLDRAALELWKQWYNVHAERQADACTDESAAALSKIEGAASRLALIFQLCDDPAATTVDPTAVERGTAIADWFTHEIGRVVAELRPTGEDSADPAVQQSRDLLAWVQRKGGDVSAREVVRALRRYKTTIDAEEALDRLAADGLGQWTDPPPSATGGRPTRRFILELRADETPPKTAESGPPADETPRDDSASRGFVGVGAVGSKENGTLETPPKVVEQQVFNDAEWELIPWDCESIESPPIECSEFTSADTADTDKTPRGDTPNGGFVGARSENGPNQGGFVGADDGASE